jgi:hypothetical protein
MKYIPLNMILERGTYGFSGWKPHHIFELDAAEVPKKNKIDTIHHARYLSPLQPWQWCR